MEDLRSPTARKADALRATFDRNYRFTRCLANLLGFAPEGVSPAVVKEMEEAGISRQYAVAATLSALFGLNPDENPDDRVFYRSYVCPSVKILNVSDYLDDLYFKTVKITDRTLGRWTLKNETYPAYRAAVCDDIVPDENFAEVVPLGFFPEEFPFPAVLEDGNEWMTLTPVDTDTSKEAIAKAHGKVVTFGLGLGYYAFHASVKPEVASVTVVERSPDVISLFKQAILPYFPHPEKIKIVNQDAFLYAEKTMPDEHFDLAFVDTWRDASDGLPMYCKMKRLEALSAGTEFLYWIEGHILSRLRAEVFEDVYEKYATAARGIGADAEDAYRKILSAISEDALREYAKVRPLV